jgi:feruloyl esterase
LASVFTTPPTAVESDASALLRYQLGLNLDDAARATERVGPRFPQSAWSIMAAQSPDRDAFRAAGGRMIVVHGAADPVFSLNDTLEWWTGLDRRYEGRAADFTRVFAVPGMNHCRAGPGTTNFDAFTALVRWVEQGAAPNRIVATAPAGTPWPGRTRPLCPHPSFARYTGGNPERAESFVCAAR